MVVQVVPGQPLLLYQHLLWKTDARQRSIPFHNHTIARSLFLHGTGHNCCAHSKTALLEGTALQARYNSCGALARNVQKHVEGTGDRDQLLLTCSAGGAGPAGKQPGYMSQACGLG